MAIVKRASAVGVTLVLQLHLLFAWLVAGSRHGTANLGNIAVGIADYEAAAIRVKMSLVLQLRLFAWLVVGSRHGTARRTNTAAVCVGMKPRLCLPLQAAQVPRQVPKQA